MVLLGILIRLEPDQDAWIVHFAPALKISTSEVGGDLEWVNLPPLKGT